MPTDYLLVIDGIKGESKDSKHPGAIEIGSFSWGATNPGSFATTGGGGTGKVQFDDIHLTGQVNNASPLLARACASGQHFDFDKAQLFVRKQGGNQQDYYVITLEDFIVSSYQSGGSEGSNALPTDQFSLNFATIKFEYKAQKDDGSLHAPVTVGYDLRQAKKL
jgi:type VI secretion system secreted protein Hcp